MQTNGTGGPMRILGYCDRPSAAPGETLDVFVSCADEFETYTVDIVRLVHGDLDDRGPGFKEEVVATPANGEYPARSQATYAGSYALVGDRPELRVDGGFSVQALIWPTTPGAGRQGIVTKWSQEDSAGWRLVIDEGGCAALELSGADGTILALSSGELLVERCWYFVAASFDAATGIARVHQEARVNHASAPVSRQATFARSTVNVERKLGPATLATSAPLVMAGWSEGEAAGRAIVGGHYNGKIEAPRLVGRALGRDALRALVDDPAGAAELIAAWDFSAEIGPDGVSPFGRITDRGPHGLHGETVNAPVRGVTGHNWAATEYHFTRAPEQYGAMHFHDDSLDDARWEADFQLTIPSGLRSGVYAARLRAGEHEDHVPFYVRPPKGTATARIAFLAPTYSYLAYANDHMGVDLEVIQLAIGRTAVLGPQELHKHMHRELGSSLYDFHSDGAGVCYSTWRRPLLTVRPKYRHSNGNAWQFNADLHLVDWFTEKGFEVDIITDSDLDAEGVALLERYQAVVTGSHPEYTTSKMLDAIEAYLEGGGRFMYMGGNGFYWVTGHHPHDPNLIEIRRWGGSEVWTAAPGEYHLGFTGELGGLWRNRGRAPQKIVGVGFIAQGLDVSSYYRRKPDSFEPGGSWVFEGVGDGELIGNFGLSGNGAAGLELDWYDPTLGSPAHAYLLASSEGHTNVMLEVRENFGMTIPNPGGDEQPHVRADLVYFTTPNGGGVFSTGSIAWCGSLSHNGYDNNVSQITENVLRRFASDEPLPQ
jgi:N,N-dimethylformamidase